MIIRKPSVATRAAFTLMEVLVVVAILVILAGVGSVAVFRYLDEAKENAARMGITNIETAIQAYKLNPQYGGDYPPTLEVLIEPIGDKPAALEQKQLLDPWGHPYEYEYQTRNPLTGKPRIISHGATPGNAAGVIANW